MTHLRKGLAAAEAVNLHLVEAGDLHGGAAGPATPVPLRAPLPAVHASISSQAPRRAALARADDALPGPRRPGSRKRK